MSTARLVRGLVILGIVLVAGALVWMLSGVFEHLSSVLEIVIFSILFAYLIYPAVKVLSRKMPRALAVAVVYAGIFVAVLIALAFLAPTVVAQAEEFARNYPATVRDVQHSIADPQQNPILQRFPAQVRDLVAKNAGKVGAYAAIAAEAVGSNLLSLFAGGASLATELAIMFGVTFMFIVDLEKIQTTLLRMFPLEWRPSVVALVMDVDTVIGGFVRSQAILAVIIAVSTILVLAITGVPYAVLLGLLIGILSIVPIIGAIVGAIPAVIVALLTVGLVKAIVVAVLCTVIFQVVGNVISPLLSAKSVGVTPLIVTIAILIGGEAYGILGILLAVPVAGIVRVVYDRLFPADPESDRIVVAARADSGDVTQPGERAKTG
jgi:predicted PurR-regulated permease PerM